MHMHKCYEPRVLTKDMFVDDSLKTPFLRDSLHATC